MGTQTATTPRITEEVEYNGLTLRLETCDLLESQFRVTGKVVGLKDRMGNDVGFEVFYCGHSNVYCQEEIPGFSQMEVCSFSGKNFPRVTPDAQKFCIDWAASKTACQQKFASLFTKDKFGQDSKIFFGAVIPYWSAVVSADPDHAFMYGSGYGSPIVGYSFRTAKEELEFLKNRFVELYNRQFSQEDCIDWPRLQSLLQDC